MLKIRTLFSGIGAPEKAFEVICLDYELVDFCEFDKDAVVSYCNIHNVDPSKNLGDITKVDTSKLPYSDFVFYGFPCQDISAAGKQKGFENEDGTNSRSGLFFEALRIIKDTQPKYAIAENVKGLTTKRFASEFKTVLDSLDEAGYNSYYKVLNSHDFYSVQNRNRVFIVSIRKDIDKHTFKFPEPRVDCSPYLWSVINDNYKDDYVYLTPKQIEGIKNWKSHTNPLKTALYTRDSKVVRTIVRRSWGDLHAEMGFIQDDVGIRKFTSRECWRLMGFSNNDYDNVMPWVSDKALYNQAGNSIVVGVLVSLFDEMFIKNGGNV